MILPDFILPSRINQQWNYSGLDDPKVCYNKDWFNQYPFDVNYQYNSRGFRDHEWPSNMEELKKAIWCIGDSFTVGIGSPIEHTWTWLLQKQTGIRTINISMDGASNSWISRKTVSILQQINPQHIVIHWSYTHRREHDPQTIHDKLWNNFYNNIKDPTWPTCDTLLNFEQLPEFIREEIISVHGGVPQFNDEDLLNSGHDEDLRAHYLPNATDQDDLDDTINCISRVNSLKTNTKILHSFIPDYCPHPGKIQKYLFKEKIPHIPEIVRLDRARDHHHYDLLTSQDFVNRITNYLV